MNKLPFDSEGRPHGLWEIHHHNGWNAKLMLRAVFHHGVLHGAFEYLDTKGDHIQKGFFRNNVAHGSWYHYPETHTDWWVDNIRRWILRQAEVIKTDRK